MGVVDAVQPPHRHPRRGNRRSTDPGGRQGDAVVGFGHRDESVFTDPYTFDIARNPNPHLAFGRGTHFCLGAALARMEIRVMLDALLDRIGRCR